MLENLTETIADKVVARIKKEDSSKPKYYTHKELCVILHVTNPTVIEMVKHVEIREKKIGGRMLPSPMQYLSTCRKAYCQVH